MVTLRCSAVRTMKDDEGFFNHIFVKTTCLKIQLGSFKSETKGRYFQLSSFQSIYNRDLM